MQNNFNFDELTATKEKYNTTVKLTEEDEKAGVRIYCKESYAQDLYNKMQEYNQANGITGNVCKDLVEGQVYDVVATQISFDNSYIKANEKNSRAEIIIPFREFTESIDSLTKGENLSFKVMVTKAGVNGQFVGSQKKCASIIYKGELFEHLKNNTWFPIKIKRLIKGGYIVLYKNDIECFIPGSHAGANVIKDFNRLLGVEMNVMVDNYDASNDLFILSYKKYIRHSMPLMISELKFSKKYSGILTNKPYDFGIFVEIESYYTGLIHSSEFSDYSEVKKYYKSGDEIDVYIKDVTKKKGNYRIVLTLDPDEINEEKKKWDQLRDKTENRTFDYEVNQDNNSISIYIDGEVYDVMLRRKDLDKNLDKYPKVKVKKVDPINKNLKFEFAED